MSVIFEPRFSVIYSSLRLASEASTQRFVALKMKGGIMAAQVKRPPLNPQINLGAVSGGNGWAGGKGGTKIIMFTQTQASRNYR